MIDIHSHVLPGIDDGSGSVEESLAMLRASARQGVDCVAATPHFYPMENTPERFLDQREEAAERLRAAWQPGLPKLLLGAEVYFFEGMSRTEALDALCLEGSRVLLLEMPFGPWTERTVSEVVSLRERRGLTVVLAHIERYFRWQPKEIWDELPDLGILTQCNAGFFLDWRLRGRARRMLREGKISFLGSDAHNMTSRPPRLGEAMALLGETERSILEEAAVFPAAEEMVC